MLGGRLYDGVVGRGDDGNRRSVRLPRRVGHGQRDPQRPRCFAIEYRGLGRDRRDAPRPSNAANSTLVAFYQTVNVGTELFIERPPAVLSTVAGPYFGTAVLLKLVRSNNLFTAYVSYDGITFTAIGSVTIALPSTVLAGLASASHSATAANTAVVNSLTIN